MTNMTLFPTSIVPGTIASRAATRSPSRAVLAAVAGAFALLCASAALADEELAPPPAPLPPSYRVMPLSPLAPPPSASAPAPASDAAQPLATPASNLPPASAPVPAVVPPPAGVAPAPAAPESPRGDAAPPAAADPAAAALDAPDEVAEPAAPEPLEGPLRPKDDPAVAATAPASGEATWNRSFDGGVRWKKGDTAVILSGTPGAGVRIGGSIAH